MDLTTAFIHALYRTSSAAARFEEAHPGERVMVAAACKAVRSDQELPLSRGSHWALARRANLVISEQRLVCGDWEIAVSDVTRAKRAAIQGTLSRGVVLRLATASGHYQFGAMAGSGLLGALPFPVEDVEERLQDPIAARAVRLMLKLIFLVVVGRGHPPALVGTAVAILLGVSVWSFFRR